MKLYLLRHGQTDYNKKGLIQGTLPTSLNNIGKMQVLKVKKQLDKIDIDLIICSPLKRTVETANIINSQRNIPIITDERIIEREMDKLQNADEKIYTNFLDLYWDTEKNYIDEHEIEPIKSLLKRTNNFIEDLKLKYKGKTILIITHGSPIVALIRNINHSNITEKEVSNCKLLEFIVGD